MYICSIDEWKNLPIFLKSQFISNSSTDGEKGLKCETGEKVASIYSISQNFKKFNSISFRPLMAKRGENKKWTKNVASIQHLFTFRSSSNPAHAQSSDSGGALQCVSLAQCPSASDSVAAPTDRRIRSTDHRTRVRAGGLVQLFNPRVSLH